MVAILLSDVIWNPRASEMISCAASWLHWCCSKSIKSNPENHELLKEGGGLQLVRSKHVRKRDGSVALSNLFCRGVDDASLEGLMPSVMTMELSWTSLIAQITYLVGMTPMPGIGSPEQYASTQGAALSGSSVTT
eukprot:2797513-Amphidinium_carterae.2